MLLLLLLLLPLGGLWKGEIVNRARVIFSSFIWHRGSFLLS